MKMDDDCGYPYFRKPPFGSPLTPPLSLSMPQCLLPHRQFLWWIAVSTGNSQWRQDKNIHRESWHGRNILETRTRLKIASVTEWNCSTAHMAHSNKHPTCDFIRPEVLWFKWIIQTLKRQNKSTKINQAYVQNIQQCQWPWLCTAAWNFPKRSVRPGSGSCRCLWRLGRLGFRSFRTQPSMPLYSRRRFKEAATRSSCGNMQLLLDHVGSLFVR